MKAIDKIYEWDERRGVGWSDDTEEIAKIMEEYLDEYKKQQKLKNKKKLVDNKK